MKKINLKKTVLGLDDKTPIKDSFGKDVIISVQLSNVFALENIKTIEPIKSADWAISLYKTGYLEIDDTDLEKLINFVKSYDKFMPIFKKRIIDELKKENEKESK